jgi:ABC-type Co2+ transport system permease subunit
VDGGDPPRPGRPDEPDRPLLAIFAAMSFTIMMFNIPVSGGRRLTASAGR